MKSKPLGFCPNCGTNNTYIFDDIIYNETAYFMRRCWSCGTNFVEYNRVVDMPWMDAEEFSNFDEQLWTANAQRRNQS